MKKLLIIFMLIGLMSCAGAARGCSQFGASSFGADWLVVQFAMDGSPMNAWKLEATAIGDDEDVDGIYWTDSRTGNLIFVYGWYNRVQVFNRNFESAAESIGIDLNRVRNGKYE